MKHFKGIVVAGLCISLFFNYKLFTMLNNLDNKINNINSYQQDVIRTVNSQIGSISNTINKIKEEQSWLSNVEVDTLFHETEKNKVDVSFQWQVKELENNSEVIFNYSLGEKEEYIPIKAEDKGNGFFQVVVPIEVTMEPNWNFQVAGYNVDGKTMRAIEEKKEAFQMGNRVDFNYYISVSNGEVIKSSEISNARIGDIGTRYYGYLEVRTELNKNNNYNLSVISGKMHGTSTYLEEAYLKKYKDGNLVDEEKLENINIVNEGGMPEREDTAIFENKSGDEMDYNSLVLKVVYSDGAVFEREVYSK